MAAPEDYAAANDGLTQNTQPINLLALCSLTLPVALDAKGVPVGLQLVARRGQEERLLAVVLACEKLLGTAPERLGAPLPVLIHRHRIKSGGLLYERTLGPARGRTSP